MKQFRLLTLLFVVSLTALLMSGCKKDDPTGPVLTKCEKPTNWRTTPNVDPQCMTVVMYADAFPCDSSKLTDQDLVAAFVGTTCRGAGSIQTAPNGRLEVLMSVYETSAESKGNSPQFVIRYWSTNAGGYYTSKPIQFVANQTLGSTSAGYQPEWESY